MSGGDGQMFSAGSAARLCRFAFLLATLTVLAPNSRAADGVFYKPRTVVFLGDFP